MKKKPTQKEVILDMLMNDKLVHPMNVLKETQKRCESGCIRLAARIFELKKEGHKIATRTVITKSGSVAYYELMPVNNFKKKKVKTVKK